ncbi:ankyrin repeat-containing domain protein [Trichophaea hybrida]|nr:ankyrin repeat-containing domain protein [Trichophaea hybrida]
MRPPPPPTPPQQPITPLLLLPADLLLSITSHLPPHSLLSLLLTSRHLHRFLLPTYHRLSATYPSALLYAACSPSPALLTHLLTHGANPNTPDPHGLTPLDHASRLGHNSIITTLLSFHARRSQTCQWILDHTTPPRERLQEALAKAVTLNSPNIARILLASGADPNSITPDQPTTLLHRAAERNRVALVELLLEYGAALDVRDGVGLMPLHYAVKGCAGEALEALLLAGADLDQGSGFGTPFSGALRRGWVGGVEIMVAWGVRIAGWDVREKWSLVKQRRLKSVEEGFLKVVGEVMGEQTVVELLQAESAESSNGHATKRDITYPGSVATPAYVPSLHQAAKSPVNPSRLCRIFTGDG